MRDMTRHQTTITQNLLSGESSPYLLQHAGNPVNWFPWGEAAFERARTENKPVFLSIGYATCHWCHVMERESFEDVEVAALMNEAFISIKVDREERPDIDSVYMTVCQIMTGGGGWPLTIIMTPQKQPFFAATYIPKISRFGRKGMMELIPTVREAWETRETTLRRSADEIASALFVAVTADETSMPGEEALALAFYQLRTSFDPRYGGFGTGMKFPTPHQLTFLLRYHRRTGNPAALDMVEKTLTAMRMGGIYDHVGFGFHRYATDPAWRIPHFEKMLYDQALLLYAYLEAYQVTQKSLYEETAHEIAIYVLRDMTSPEGGFYSAEDADSEGEEGLFYLWTQQEIRSVLDAPSSALLEEVFDIREEGNVEETASGNPRSNVLVMKADIAAAARKRRLSEDEAAALLSSSRAALFAARRERVRPFKDDKILTDWNGLMMGALARAGRVLGDAELIVAAEKNAAFVLARLTREDGRLVHRFRHGKAGLPAHLDDYAFVVSGLIELYEATYEPSHLDAALRLNALMIEHFTDPGGGALFLTADDAEMVLTRVRELYDGALPSGNSVAFLNLLKLARMTANRELDRTAHRIAEAFGPEVKTRPISHTMFLNGLDFAIGPSVEVVLAGHRNSADTGDMMRALDSRFDPSKVVLLREESTAGALAAVAPFTASQPMVEGRATAYVCVGHACALPTTDPREMLDIIREKLARKVSVIPA
jgi:uncharacterized protein YyaL (SSP411 family)